ncbi:IS4 family transposase, partial [Accumulibacter sp.]
LAEVAELIDWYRARWEIEILFHILKNGCRIESLQLQTIDGLQRAIALYLIVSWRIALLMRFGRTCPDLPAELFFDQDECHAAYLLNKKKPPADPPTLNQVLRLVAMLGGFLARKGDGEPGVKTIWIGLQRVMDCVIGLQFMREAAPG